MNQSNVWQQFLRSVRQILPPLCWQCECFLTRQETTQVGYPFLCKNCIEHLPEIDSNQLCFRCGKAKNSASLSCQHNFPLSSTLSAFWYEQPFVEWIPRWKYHGQAQMSQLLGYLLQLKILPQISHLEVDLILPVPLHQKRLQERGFNQSQLLAYFAFPAWRKKIRMDVLFRTKATSPQTRLSAKERQKNVSHAFAIKQDVAQKKILLVDDVYTTGATLHEIQRQLKLAGASSLTAVTLARRK